MGFRISKNAKLLYGLWLIAMIIIFGSEVAVNHAYAVNGKGEPIVVSLGDSYSSGEGTEPFYDQEKSDKYSKENWLAHRSEKAWPGLLAIKGVVQNKRKDKGWYFVASSGAVTAHILGNDHEYERDGEKLIDKAGGQTKYWSKWTSPFTKDSGSKTLPCQNTVLDKYRGSIDYVTLTIGGNDLGFADVVGAAAKDTNFIRVGALKKQLEESINHFENNLKETLLELYDYVHSMAGNQSEVFVAGYPRLFPSQGRGLISAASASAIGTVYNLGGIGKLLAYEAAGLISAEEAQLINAAINTFDTEMSSAVSSSGKQYVRFVDVRSEFAGHEEQYINNITIGPQSQDLEVGLKGIVSSYSVHPNAEGHEAYARAVQKAIDEFERDKSSSSAQVIKYVDVKSDVAISLVFDVSGSMDDPSAYGSQTKLANAKQQSTAFVNGSIRASGEAPGLSTRVGVCSFTDYAQVECNLSSDASSVAQAIASLEPQNTTNMYAGLEAGVRQLEGQDGTKIMMYLSDGLTNEGPGEDEILELAREAADAGITVYTIGYGASGDLDEDLLEEIARITGGTYSHEDPSDASNAAVGLFASMMEAQLKETQQVLLSQTGAVSQDGTEQVGTIDVNSSGTLTCYLYWPGSVLDIKLTDPEGVEVTPEYSGCTIDDSSIPTRLVIDGAKEGTWAMSVYGREVSMEQEPFYAAVSFEEHEVPEAVQVSGGVVQDNGPGILLLIATVFVGCMLGVYALSIRRR